MKKPTTSKIALFIPYVFAVVLLLLMIYEIKTEASYNYLNYTEVAFVSVLSLCGYTQKWYTKKASLENEPKVRLGIVKDLFEYQQLHQDFNIYDKATTKADVQNIINPIKADGQRQYEKMITDDTDSKIV